MVAGLPARNPPGIQRRVTGQSYAEFVRAEIFLPLGMTNSAVPGSPGRTAQGPVRELGRFYEQLLRDGQRANSSRPTLSERGHRPSTCGGSASERLDLLGRNSLLTADSVRLLTARHRVGMLDITFGQVMDWGLGFLLNTGHQTPYSYGPHASENTFGHGGRQSSSAFGDPDRQLAVAWACAGQPGEAAHQRRALAINTAIYEDLGLVP
jgi:CubicO group peptidase (beta-lactamase class C family)